MHPSYEQLSVVLDAAKRVLAARQDQLLTSEEWDALTRAVVACDGPDNVPPEHACPGCGERNTDNLAWVSDESIECQTCHKFYYTRRDE